MCRETVHQGGPSNRELLHKMIRLSEQLEIIQQRLTTLEGRVANAPSDAPSNAPIATPFAAPSAAWPSTSGATKSGSQRNRTMPAPNGLLSGDNGSGSNAAGGGGVGSGEKVTSDEVVPVDTLQ